MDAYEGIAWDRLTLTESGAVIADMTRSRPWRREFRPASLLLQITYEHTNNTPRRVSMSAGFAEERR